MDKRQQQLQIWLSEKLHVPSPLPLSPLTGDASFRRYFRTKLENKSYIAVDSPPEKEPVELFIKFAKTLSQLGLKTPIIFHYDLEQGFLFLSDFGENLYIKMLNANNADQLYKNAIQKLLILQHHHEEPDSFNQDKMLEELQGFTSWFLKQYLGLQIDSRKEDLLNKTYRYLIKQACQQPQCFIHRDYHSRNLVVLPDNEVGILDFQDAMMGPITYDLVSLLKDCYVDWPSAQVLRWAKYYYEQAIHQNLIHNLSFKKFLRSFELMGVQRHLKAIFIFSRKYIRDHDKAYLKDIPRTLNYILNTTSYYLELYSLQQWLNEDIIPSFDGVYSYMVENR